MSRETIYAALFALLQNKVTGVTTYSRKLKHWADVEPHDQPALFQTQTGEDVAQSKGLPATWNFGVKLYLYVNTSNGSPSTILNPLIDAIEAALKPNANGFQELGGLVSHCWIDGRIETSEGTLGDQEVAIIPISIKVANQLFG